MADGESWRERIESAESMFTVAVTVLSLGRV